MLTTQWFNEPPVTNSYGAKGGGRSLSITHYPLPSFIFGRDEERKAHMSQIRAFRMTALAEGVSFLTLLCVAMPMKYFMGMPEVVRVVGAIHGGLFLLYVGLLAMLHVRQRWPVMFSLYALVASVIPFGTFVLDKHLRAKEAGEIAVKYEA